MSTKAFLFKGTLSCTNWTLIKTEGWFFTVGSLAMMSLYYKAFNQSGPPIQQKGATFDQMNFCFKDGCSALN